MNHPLSRALSWCGVAVLALVLLPWHARSDIVINEVHYNPDVKTEPAEFIELYNAGPGAVNLAGWYFSDGLDFIFPATNVAAGGFVVVAQNPAFLQQKFGVAGALGPFHPDGSSALSSRGERIVLRDAGGQVQDEVEYGSGFPWPTVGDSSVPGNGPSMELIHPSLDNNLGGSWRSSGNGGGAAGGRTTLLATGQVWRYFKGTTEASTPTTLWRQPGFDDSAWSSGGLPIGYGESFIVTPLDDMRGSYTSVFLRKTFVVSNPLDFNRLVLEAQYDDGFKLWINGTLVIDGGANMPVGEVPFDGTAVQTIENLSFIAFDLPQSPASLLLPGTNLIAVQLHNVSVTNSSDCFFDARLIGDTGASSGTTPTPGRVNTVFANNAPPQIRQVAHTPEQPTGGQTVTITAKVTDPDGVAGVKLEYQVVNPGSYIELTDAAFTNAANWVELAMNDSGTGGDVLAGDSIYTAQIPAVVQQHRRLIRYRVRVTDTLGASVRVPYADDPVPNFAYFVYNGVPGWRGAVQPGAAGANGATLSFSSNVMSRLPVIQLIGRSNTIAQATWFSRYGGDAYQWLGTLVYDGKVYDHVHYRARGGVWRYSMVKNMWKFNLNRGHDLEARDNWGRKFKVPWTKLNLGANIQQGDYDHRGEQGLFESIGFRMFQMAGVAAPHTAFCTLRVVDDVNEASAGTQYEGDFWGVYLMVEQEDGRFLEAHDLPDSNFYKMEGGTGDLNNLGPDGPTDKSDLNYLLNNYTSKPDSWWRTNWNLPRYYSYQAIIQAIHHYDINGGKNYFYYFDPRSRLWEVVPWDLDLTWANNMYNTSWGGLNTLASRILDATAVAGTGPHAGTSNLELSGATRPDFRREFRNRVREIRDLMFNDEQAFRLIDEYAALVRGPTNGPTILDADRMMWDYNPKMINGTYTPNLGKAGQGRFYAFPRESGTNTSLKGSFDASIRIMKHYVGIRSDHLDSLSADALIPDRPTITYTGPSGYPINRLTFRTSNFSTPDGAASFGAIKWRVAAVSYPDTVGFSLDEPWQYEIEDAWEVTNAVFVADLTLPPEAVRANRTFRIRAQFVDRNGRNSHWSAPIEFAVGEPDGAADLLNYLRVTEVMYHPPDEGYEFVELHNTSSSLTLDLAGVKFTQGIDFTFPVGATLPPGGYLVLVGTADLDAFRAYYGLDLTVPLYGPFSGALNNAGELVTLRTAAGGTDIVAFNYGDGRGWPAAADGGGHSIVLLDSALVAEGAGAGNYAANWRASAFLRGSPGRADEVVPPPVMLNEIVAHTDYTNTWDSNDWIELYNPTETNFVFGPGWYLSDDLATLTKWAVPATNQIPARGWLAFDEITGFHNPTNTGFGLNKAGEDVFLSYLPGTAEDRVVDVVSFKGQEAEWSLGRYPDGAPFWFALNPQTRDAANSPPLPQVVITEVHFHPPDIGTNDNSLDEFIEVYNPTAAPVSLFNTNGAWRLSGGVDFMFPTNLVMEPDGFVTVVNFDPFANPAQLAAFRSLFEITNPSAVILGPYAGKLNNSSDRVALERPQAPDLPGDSVSWVVVDEVLYSDQSPWPCAADGTGNSLQRVSPTSHGSDPANWTSQPPTPTGPRENLPVGAASIVSQPQSRAAPTNGTATFSVSVCGTPPFTYRWRFNGAVIPGATNAILYLANLRLEDSGEYTVEVGNAAGAVLSTPAQLWVQLPPVITQHPQNLTVVRDQEASFSVAATGTPPFSYQWRFNGTNLPGETNFILTLPVVRTNQAGQYSALVINSAGSAVSGNAILTVMVPATIVVQPQETNVNEGATVTLVSDAIGDGVVSYQWRFDGTPIPGAVGPTLVLTNIVPAQQGVYDLVVSNAFGMDLSEPAFLGVLVMPVIIVPPLNQVVPEGGTFTVSVSIRGGPPPFMYQWRRGSAIAAVEVSDSTNSFFTYGPVTTADQMTWRIALTNAASPILTRVTTTFTVTVQPDFDRDGLPDLWEVASGFSTNDPANASADLDGDGMTLWQEYIAGTDWNDPLSYLRIDALSTPGNASLEFLAVSNRTYRIEYTDDLAGGVWTKLAEAPARATNRLTTVNDARPPGVNQRFYRLVTP